MTDMEQRYEQRFDRYTTAMRNEQPDRIPIRPFVAEFTGTYAGFTCQELAHDCAKITETTSSSVLIVAGEEETEAKTRDTAF